MSRAANSGIDNVRTILSDGVESAKTKISEKSLDGLQATLNRVEESDTAERIWNEYIEDNPRVEEAWKRFDEIGTIDEEHKAAAHTLWVASRNAALGEIEPLSVSIDVTSSCNLRCNHCYVYEDEEEEYGEKWGRNKEQDLPEEEWLETIDKYQEENPHIIQATWVGGEPMIRWDFIKSAAQKFPENTVVTNGTQGIPDQDEYDANINFRLSLDGAREDHDHNRGEGVFDKAMESVDNTDSYVRGHTVIGPWNLDSIEDLAEQTYDTLDGIRFSIQTPPRVDGENVLAMNPEERDEAVEKIQRINEKYGDFVDMSETEIEYLGSEYTEEVFAEGCPIRGEDSASIPLGFDGEVKGKCVMGDDADCGNCGCTVVPATYNGLEDYNVTALTNLS